MNLKQLDYFIRVAELGSFSKAALVLGIAQPALSRQVRQLETGLRVTLLTRTGRGVVLTEPGKRLFEHGVGILQLVARATEDIQNARNEPAGRIVIGLPPSMGRRLTRPLVERFRGALPSAHLVIAEGLSTHLIEWIATGRIDIGLVLNPDPSPAIDITPVLDEPLGLVGHAQPPKRQREAFGSALRPASSPESRHSGALPFARLPDYPLILPERTHVIRKLIDMQAALMGIKLNIALEVSSVQSILDLVRAGHGHAVLARTALATQDAPDDFTFCALDRPALSSMLCLAVSANRPVTPLGRQTLHLLKELSTTLLRAANPQQANP